ncbi:MAG TPA: SdrD B-like domain-containing protein [Blastocatellia bacterium]|nr:SdrD B-like domain-containing protein [Blastocatellia bacterium]
MSSSAKSSHDKTINASLITRSIFLIAFLSAFSVLSLRGISPAGAAASGIIRGVVFQDFNSNGVRDVNPVVGANGAGNIGLASDRGVQGVSITAYGPSGAVAGAGVSGADGSYSLTAAGAGPYRVEFSNLPAGFQLGPHGVGVGTTVQFVPDGDSSNINLALVVPQEYCQNNPTLVTSCFVGGPQNVGSPVIISFPYSAGTTRDGGPAPFGDYDNPRPGMLAAANQAGTTWGLAYSRSGRILYAAAFMKKHTGFGPQGTGAIYKIDRTNPGVITTFVNLNTVLGAGAAGADPHNQSDYLRDNGNATWDAVGKASLGGLAISDDETKLYAMNLASRQLLEIPTGVPPTSANIRSRGVPTNPPGCPNATDVRPFAVNYYQGKVYVGMVCSAESTISQSLPDGDASKLQAYVYSVDPVSLDFSAAPVFQASLNYPRRCADSAELGESNCFSADWRAWSPVYKNIGTERRGVYPQPWLAGIAFDRGNLILGLRDRAGDQFGIEALDNPADNILYYGITAGDLLRACGSPATGWTLENNGRCGGGGGAPQNSGQGPGGGEFYFREDGPPFHDEVSVGGVLVIPGHPDVAFTMFDPIPVFEATTLFDGGVRWLNNATGGYARSYRVYDGERVFNGPFGKANGLGDLKAFCDAAPIEIGNRIWRDLDADGIQDANEPGVPGVTVQLSAPDGTSLATAVTDANGDYYFSSAAGANSSSSIYGITGLAPNVAGYKLRLSNPADFTGNGPLANNNLSPVDAGGASQDQRDSDAMLMSGSPAVTFNTGGPGANNHTYDFGFIPQGQPPNITCPINMTAPATSVNGAVVTYPTPTATNGATVTCTPPSGSTFPVGVTTVSCTATNSAGSASCSFMVTITPVPQTGADLAVFKTDNETIYTPGGLVVYSITVTNKGPAAVANARVVDKTPIALTNVSWTCRITAQGGGAGTSACGGTFGTGDINTTVSLRSGGVAAYTLRANISTNATGNLINTATVTTPPGVTDPNPGDNTSTDIDVRRNPDPQPPGPVGPGTPHPGWSVLIFPVYTSKPADPEAEDTRINLTNISTTQNACVHLFFVDGASCLVADANLCLTPNQTTSFLASEFDPGTMGYVIAVAVDCETGCPTNLNTLIGDEYVKFESGFRGNLMAECITAIRPPACDPNAQLATLNFDGVTYSQLPRMLALDNIPSAEDNNSTLLVLDRIGGDLSATVGALGSIFGILYDDTENGFSFTFIGGSCQVKQTLSNNFPRAAPRFDVVIPSGRSGWMKLWTTSEIAVIGAMFNRNPNAAGSSSAFEGAHGLHALRLQSRASFTIPVFPPGC